MFSDNLIVSNILHVHFEHITYQECAIMGSGRFVIINEAIIKLDQIRLRPLSESN